MLGRLLLVDRGHPQVVPRIVLFIDVGHPGCVLVPLLGLVQLAVSAYPEFQQYTGEYGRDQ